MSLELEEIIGGESGNLDSLTHFSYFLNRLPCVNLSRDAARALACRLCFLNPKTCR